VIVGFTGSRQGMTQAQREAVVEVLMEATEAHHGDCVGADREFHEICEELGIDVVLHPPTDPKLRAWCHATRVEEPRPYLERNRQIVKAAELMVATPKEKVEPPPSRGQGTWSCIRYARKLKRELLVVFP
jgi:hypothetical protein